MKTAVFVILAATVSIRLTGAQVSDNQKKAQDPPSSKNQSFNDGNALMTAGKYCDALAAYQVGLKSLPEDLSLLYNEGLAAYRCKQFETSVKLWSTVKVLNPTDWETRAKLIQAYQALGEKSERERERTELVELWKRGTIEDLLKQTEFCRDQFAAAGEQVMAFEQFELKGDRAVRYIFSVLDDRNNREKYRISLGSYKATNAIWHETTKPKPKDSERLFHLDGYYDWGHATYAMYSPEPSYDEVRDTVIEILEKKKGPMSTSIVGSNPQ